MSHRHTLLRCRHLNGLILAPVFQLPLEQRSVLTISNTALARNTRRLLNAAAAARDVTTRQSTGGPKLFAITDKVGTHPGQ